MQARKDNDVAHVWDALAMTVDSVNIVRISCNWWTWKEKTVF